MHTASLQPPVTDLAALRAVDGPANQVLSWDEMAQVIVEAGRAPWESPANTGAPSVEMVKPQPPFLLSRETKSIPHTGSVMQRQSSTIGPCYVPCPH